MTDANEWPPLPPKYKWILFAFMVAFIIIVGTYAVLLEHQYTKISIDEAKSLIKTCRITKVYEIGSPSKRTPSRVRTLLERKDGEIMSIEYGARINVLQGVIDDARCSGLRVEGLNE
jgi:hypothetical protein